MRLLFSTRMSAMATRFDPVNALPSDRPLSDAELAIALAQAILHDQLNPGRGLPFQPAEFLARLGVREGSADVAWKRGFAQANPAPELTFRLAAYCWRLVGLGYLVPELAGDWGLFHPTARGRLFLENLDPVALTPGGLDAKLAAIGLEPDDLPRQYARLAQNSFLAGHYESSIVMLGVATESLMLELATAVAAVQSSVAPPLRPRPTPHTARQDVAWVTEAMKAHRKHFRLALRDKGLDDEWIETLIDLIDGTAQAIRLTRNELGHPTGITAEQSDALQLVVLFPRFAEVSIRATSALNKL